MRKLLQMFAFSTVIATGIAVAQTPAKVANEPIAQAKSEGKVWCNTSTKACYNSDQPKFYGKSTPGKFIFPKEVKAEGFHMNNERIAKPAKGQ